MNNLTIGFASWTRQEWSHAEIILAKQLSKNTLWPSNLLQTSQNTHTSTLENCATFQLV